MRKKDSTKERIESSLPCAIAIPSMFFSALLKYFDLLLSGAPNRYLLSLLSSERTAKICVYRFWMVVGWSIRERGSTLHSVVHSLV